MNSRRTNTPFTLRSKEAYKKSCKNTVTKFANDYSNLNQSPATCAKNVSTMNPASVITVSVANGDTIRRSTSFKSKPIPPRRALGCTYYGKEPFCKAADLSMQKPKSASRKKRLVSMHKTAANWGISNVTNDYSYDSSLMYGGDLATQNKGKSRTNSNYQFSSQKQKMQLVDVLPKISRKENTRFVPNPATDKRDEYIRYIINKKKANGEGSGNNNGRASRIKVRAGDIGRRDEGSARRGSKEISSNNTIDTHSFSIGGINFEVHSRRGVSPTDSVEYLKTRVSKEMNLMFYDFNGAAKRMASESPQPKEPCNYSPSKKKLGAGSTIKMIYQNKTAEKFFQRKGAGKVNSKKMKSTASTHDATSEKPSATSFHHSMVEDDADSLLSERSDTGSLNVPQTVNIKIFDQAKINSDSAKRSKSPPGLAPFSNNSKRWVINTIVTEKLRCIIAQQKPTGNGTDYMAKFRDKILCLKSQIQDNISELSSEESHDSND